MQGTVEQQGDLKTRLSSAVDCGWNVAFSEQEASSFGLGQLGPAVSCLFSSADSLVCGCERGLGEINLCVNPGSMPWANFFSCFLICKMELIIKYNLQL